MNPGYAGFNNALEGTMAHRLQWRGIEGAPTTSFLGLHGALGQHIGLGGKITIDETDILQRITGGASMAYRLKLGADQQLAVGLTAAFTQNRIQFEDVIVGDAMDDLLFNSNQNGTTVDLEFGLTYQWKRLQVGLAGMQLLESGVNHDRQDGEGTLELRRHWVGFARYEFPISASWFFQPSAMIRAQEDGDAQVDLNGQVSWRHRLYIGGGYRQDAGVIALASVRMADRIMVGYAFEFSGSGIANNSNGSHEFMLGYGLRRWKKPPPKPKEPEVSAVVKSDTTVLDSNG
ncbi:MAG: PorP/SprF family type IX secretion system membrane protein, partial [Bacteroidota bacterium]